MRLHIHDGSGHPIAVQLSRELARRGHTVLHTYATQWVSGHGRLTTGPEDPPTLSIEGITAKSDYDKYSPRRRIAWEVAYAKAFQRVLAREQWDVVILCNTQLITAAVMRRWLRNRRQPWVLWHQDIFAFAFADEAARKLPGPAAALVGRAALRTEQKLVTSSSAVVAIGDPFIEQYREWGLPVRNVRMIPNWAPLEEIARLPRDEVGEAWARERDIPPAQVRLLYAGMLGRKHNPQLLVDLLEQIRATGVDAQLVVASEGPGADYLADQRPGRPWLHVLGFQPAEDLARMLASGDVLVAVLEPEASRFSIPSKVLSYLAAGRPILAMTPAENPCVVDVTAGGGHVVAPTDKGAAEGAAWVSSEMVDPERRDRIGAQARAYAQSKFDISGIADEFEELLRRIGVSEH
jgi:colanic acid biosynthesis glycosyl transferase WcaI